MSPRPREIDNSDYDNSENESGFDVDDNSEILDGAADKSEKLWRKSRGTEIYH
jgi:hypothetical protein